jgi:hypothetical protein
MRKNTNTSSLFTFPVGKGGFYHPIGVTPVSNIQSLYVAEYFNAAYSSLLVDASLTAVSNFEYWDLARTSGAGAAITLSLDGITPVPGATANDGLVVAHFDGANWVSVNQTPIIPGDAISGSAVSTVLNTFSPFTFGIKPLSALPTKLVSFKGSIENKHATLQWTTSGETNVNKYVLEQSYNGRSFVEIGNIAARNTTGFQTYTFYQNEMLVSNSYFRLKMIDNDGRFSYSGIVLIKTSGNNNITLLNNPVTNNNIQFQLNGFAKGNYEVQLFNSNGLLLKKQSIYVDGNSSIHQLYTNSSSKGGVVVLKVIGENTSNEIRLLIL